MRICRDNHAHHQRIITHIISTALYCPTSALCSAASPINKGKTALQNIVGYAQSKLQQGGTLATPQFVSVGDKGDISLNALTPVGEDTYNNVSIQTLDAYGYTLKSYTWTDAGGEDWDQTGWVDDDNNIVSGVTFKPGLALWVQGSSLKQGLQSSGSVGMADVVVQLQQGGTLSGNPFPVSLTIGELSPTGNDTYNNITIQALDAYGYTLESYTWTDAGGEDWDQTGWVDDDNNIVSGIDIEPGQGLWIQGSSDSQFITFPAPEM